MKAKNLTFRSQQAKGLTYWVCLCDNKVIATSWTLLGVRKKVQLLIHNPNWEV